MFSVVINDDNIVESNENFNLSISSSSLPTGIDFGNPREVTVTIVDDDGKHNLDSQI